MHAVGLHSALAIKRQRKRRDEQRRARERRYSSQSGESGLTSPRLSTASLDHHQHTIRTRRVQKGMLDTKVVTSIGMLHVGVVFLVLGAFLLISGILPSDLSSLKNKYFFKWWNELIAIGLFSIAVGCFLIILNRIISKKEEDDLEKYVKRQLTRSKSGHRLERDIETGELATKHAKKAKQCKALDSSFPIDNRRVKGTMMTLSSKSTTPTYTTDIMTETQSKIEPSIFLEEIVEEEGMHDRLMTLTQLHIDPKLTCERKILLKNNCNRNNSSQMSMHNLSCVEVPEI